MRTLSDVFTPGAPSLPEGLRTLAVSPERELEPGITVRASFTFRNQGGATATGVRVRFNLPDGLVYLVGSGTIDGTVLDDEQGNSPLLARAGADIGDVQPGEERRIDIAYSVAGAIENGTPVELQAAVTAFELPPVGSNIVRLVARSRPALENALTTIGIESRSHEPRAGGEATVTVRVHNAGESSARDVVVAAPIPEHATYVPNSARVNGREFERDLLGPFDRARAPIITHSLPASATVTLQYRVRIDEPLADGTLIVARAQIASQETAAFSIEPAALTVRAHPQFDDDRTVFTIEPEGDVTPGSRITMRFNVYNAGATTADNVGVALQIPDGLYVVRGGVRIDGHPLREKKSQTATFDLGSIAARESVELTVDAMVSSPMADGTTLPVHAALRWGSGGEDQTREFERTVTVRARPHLHRRRNRIERSGSPVVHPSDEVETTILLANDGAAAAHDCVLQLHCDAGFDDVRVFEKNTRLDLHNTSVELGTLEAYASRRLTVRARVRTPYADRAELSMGATLHAQELGEIALGSVSWRVDSRPAFSPAGSTLSLAQDDVFRPNQLVDAHLRLRNEGTDAAQNVRVRVYVSPEARLEHVDGAARERSEIVIGEIPPGATAEVRLGVRLLRSLARAHPVSIEAVVSADGMLPVQLASLTIVTTAEPNFAIGTLRSLPQEYAEAGEEVEFILHVRNSGDGPARRTRLSVPVIDTLIYVPNTTTVNDIPVRDAGSQSVLMNERGLVMTDVDPGVEATIRWREVVNTTVASGTTLTRRVRIEYDGDRVDDIAAEELKIRTAPAFASTIVGLPFGLDGMLGPSAAPAQRALSSSEFVELPPATPVARGELATRNMLAIPAGNGHANGHGNGELHAQDIDVPHEATGMIRVLSAFDRDRLDRAMRFLHEARFTGLITHLFALRAFFPDAIGGVEDAAVHELREHLRESLDRVYIKLRVPNYVLAPRDVETAAARASLEAVVRTATPDVPVQRASSMPLHGTVDGNELHALRVGLDDAPLATALPWAIMARLLPNEGDALAHYRTMLAGVLDELHGADEVGFIDALQRKAYPVLDAALEVVRAQLGAVRA